MNTIMDIHTVRSEMAREFSVSQFEHKKALAVMDAAGARYAQAYAYLTYLDNIEYAMKDTTCTL